MTDNIEKQNQARALLKALHMHPPSSWNEEAVAEFHEMVSALEVAYAIDLSSFRVEGPEMKPRKLAIQRASVSGRFPAHVQMSTELYCNKQSMQRKISGIQSIVDLLKVPGERLKLSKQNDNSVIIQSPSALDVFAPLLVVSIKRDVGTPRERQWGAQMAQDRHSGGRFDLRDELLPGDEVHCELFVEPLVVSRVDPVILAGGLSHWKATLQPRSEWSRARQANNAILALKPKYPRPMHHPTRPPITVYSKQEEAKLDAEWSSEYIYKPYPRFKYHWTKQERVVKSLEEEIALGGGWGAPQDFAPYRGARPARTNSNDPLKWIGAWTVQGLPAKDQNALKAPLLRADSEFWKSPDMDLADVTAMKVAFDGIAKFLLDTGILTEQLLEKEIPVLVWDSAIAGGWYRFASETPESVFPEQIGHYWVWRDDTRDRHSLFRAEQAKWLAELLDTSPSRSAPRKREGVQSRRRDPQLQKIKERVRQLRNEGLSDRDICRQLGDGLRPPRAEWRNYTWPVAYQRHPGAVAKWLSEACS